MQPLVLELQRECLNTTALVSDILRKALVVSTKLGITEFRTLCKSELNGYSGPGNPPEYRKVQGQVKVLNPNNGWQPFIFENPEQGRALSERYSKQSISELEDLLKRKDGNEDELQMHFPSELLSHWSDTEFMQLGLVPTLIVSKSSIRRIVDSIRNLILEWSLRLEEEGVLGVGMTFSAKEKQHAASIIYNMNRIPGVVDENAAAKNVQISNYNSMHQKLKELGVAQEQRNELETIMDEVPAADPKQKKILIKKGQEWVQRNQEILGPAATHIKTWLKNQ